MERARQGDRDAFADLVRHYDSRLRALAFHLLGGRQLMDDVMQEAYLKAFRALPRFRGRSSIGTWLYRLTYNACIDELKRARRRPLSAELPAAPQTGSTVVPDPGEEIVQKSALRNALMGLSPTERAAVWLVDGAGFDYDGAAMVLGIPAGTVASRLSRGRDALRGALKEFAPRTGR